jgi:hypothetical protein
VGRAVGVLLVVALATACASRAVRPSVAAVDRPPAPRLLGVFTAWAGTLPAMDGMAVGSLSGLAYHAASRRWVAASDEIRVPRLVWFDVALGPALGIAPSVVTKIALAPDVAADTLTALDMEELTVFPDGSFAVSHEGHIDREGVARQPRVLIVTRDGVVTEVVRPRAHFTIDPADRTRGVRHNLGFESLTRTPDGRLLAANEQPLAQDGPLSDTAAGGLVRIAEFVRSAAGRWTPGREWPYRLEPTPVVAGYDRPCEDGQNGVSSFVALSDTTLLAVERACLLGAEGTPAYNPVRLYELMLTGADDVSGIDALAGRSPVTVRKRLVLDLASWRADLPASLRTGSNIEGVALGPPGPKGERTVMLVSDDNFRATQTTAFLWLALE